MKVTDIQSLSLEKETEKHKPKSLFSTTFSLQNRASFWQAMSVLLESGIGLMDTLEILQSQQKKPMIQEMLGDIRREVESGNALFQALKQDGRFSDFELCSVEMGEMSGRLGQVCKQLASFYGKKAHLRKKSLQALSYPIVVLLIAVGVLGFMLAFVVPMFADIFARFDAELPWMTSWVLSASRKLQDSFLYGLIAMVFLCVSLMKIREKEWGRAMEAKIVLAIPLWGTLIQKLQLTRLAYSLSLLLQAGVSMDKVLLMLERVIVFHPYQQALRRVNRQVVEGRSLVDAIQEEHIFSMEFVQMIRIGEETAKLGPMMAQYAQRTDEEVEIALAQLTQLLEPVLIVVLGGMVAFILIAMYLPMFGLSGVM